MRVLTCALVLFIAPSAGQQELTRGHELWRQRLSKSALEAFAVAARDRASAGEAHEAIGRIYMFKGWQQEGVFPGWHDEPEYRERAIAEFQAALAAEPSRASAAEALKQAREFAAAPGVVPPAAPSADVQALDAKIDAFKGATAPLTEFDAAIEARTKLQADPSPYFNGAQIMLDRGEDKRAIDLATRGAAAAERFISENESAYRMTGKSTGSRARMRAASLDILGSVALAQKDLSGAAKQFNEADRLTRGQDFAVRFHLGELARAEGDLDGAREHYLDALSLSGGPPPLRERAKQAAIAIHAAQKVETPFDEWLAEEINRRRSERQTAALRSTLDRPLPALALTGLDGRPVDPAGVRGKVLLLNFFSSW